MVRSVPIIRRKWIGCPKHHWNHLPQSPPMISCPTSIYHRSVHIYTIDIRTRSKKKKKLQKSYLYLNWNIYIWWNLPLPCRLGIALLIKNRCIPARQVTRFFQAPVQKGATPRGGCHPSQLAAAQRAAAVFVLSTWPGRCQVQPPQGWFVGSGGSWMFVVDISAVV